MASMRTDFRREEARAVFVLGIIATLLATKDIFEFKIGGAGLTFSSQDVLGAITLWWGLYTFLMVIGLPDDVFGPRLAQKCTHFAKYALGFGVVVVAEFAFLGISAYTFAHFLDRQTTYTLSFGLSSILAIGLGFWLRWQGKVHGRTH